MSAEIEMSRSVAPEDHETKNGQLPPTNKQIEWKKLKRSIYHFLDSGPVQLFIMLLLLFSLFISDAWVLGNAPNSQDNAMYGVLLFVFSVFMVESILLSISEPGYFLSFFFYMDIVGTLFILFDIGYVLKAVMGKHGHSISVLRATRTARLGARYGRLMRLLKLMRFTRYCPCVKGVEEESQTNESELKAVRKVANQISNIISMRVAMIIMVCVILVPYMHYIGTDFSEQGWADFIALSLSPTLASNSSNPYSSFNESSFDSFVQSVDNFYSPHKNVRLLSLSIDTPSGLLSQSYVTRRTLRSDNEIEYTSSYYSNSQRYDISLWIDYTIPNQWDALFGILLIIMVITLLFSFSADFQNTFSRLVVLPMEKMTQTLKQTAQTMLKNVKGMKKEKETAEKKEEESDDYDDEDDDGAEDETRALEDMVAKLTRIVSHALPGTHDLKIDDKNVDASTAKWLNQAFGGQDTVEVEQKLSTVMDEREDEAENIKELESIQHLVPLTKLNSWDFDVLEYSTEDLCSIVTYIFTIHGVLKEFHVTPQVFQAFLKEISHRYVNTNTYHNFSHGVDVMHTVYRLIHIPQLVNLLSPVEVYSMLVASLAHDVGHPGLNNVYLVKSKSDLALRHNDSSPLENMHCAVLYEIMSKSSATNIFSGFTEKQWRESRKIIIMMILGTDMINHQEQIKNTQVFLEISGEDVAAYCKGEKDSIEVFQGEDPSKKHFIMELLLHCADISNPYKTFPICCKWAELVSEEFFQQGDREKKEGLDISPMCDRTVTNLNNMQAGFIEFAVAPLINALVKTFPPLHEIGSNMLSNYNTWTQRRLDEIPSDPSVPTDKKAEQIKGLEGRKAKFNDNMSYLNDLRGMKVRPRNSISGANK